MNASQIKIQELLSKLEINGTVAIQDCFDEQAIVVSASDLNPKLRKSLIDSIDALNLSNIELDHSFSPELSQKAYDILRFQNPSYFIDLDADLTKIHHFDLASNGRKVVEMVQDLLIGNSTYSHYIWEGECLPMPKLVITDEEVKKLIAESEPTPLLLLDEVEVLESDENEITLGTDGYLVIQHPKQGEIFGRFHADFTVNQQDEISVELLDLDQSAIRSEKLSVKYVVSSTFVKEVEDDHIDYLDEVSIAKLLPNESHQTVFVELFKKQMENTSYDALVAKYK